MAIKEYQCNEGGEVSKSVSRRETGVGVLVKECTCAHDLQTDNLQSIYNKQNHLFQDICKFHWMLNNNFRLLDYVMTVSQFENSEINNKIGGSIT